MEKTALISFGVGIAAASAGFLFRELSQKQQAKEIQGAMDRAIAAKKREDDLDLQRREHRPLQQADGSVHCSCGFEWSTMHHYNLHIEHHVPYLKPLDATGWPARQFETVPVLPRMQKCIVSKGNLKYAYFVTVSLKNPIDKATVMGAIGHLPQLTTSVGAVDPDARLLSAVAVSAALWKQWDPAPPRELRPLHEKKSPVSGETIFPDGARGGDLFLLLKCNRVDLCWLVARKFIEHLGSSVDSSQQTIGFSFLAERRFGSDFAHDLTGFIDGTRNPDHLLRAIVDEIAIFPDDEGASSPHVGGSYLWAGRFVHNLTKFYDMSDAEKNQVIGRDLSRVCPHKGYDSRPENPRLSDPSPAAHAVRAFGSMYRHAYPYRHEEEEGLYFCAFARSLSELDTTLNRMAGINVEGGIPDNLFSITRCVRNNYYYVPSMEELRMLAQDAVASQVPGSASSLAEASQRASTEPRKELPVEPRRRAEEEEADSVVDINPSKLPADAIQISIEYCTNCGYKSIYNEKAKVLRAVDPRVVIVGNPSIPRQSAFEVTLADGTVLWSKLSQPDGRNNHPSVFPTNAQLVAALCKYLKKPVPEAPVQAQSTLYTKEGTRMGVW